MMIEKVEEALNQIRTGLVNEGLENIREALQHVQMTDELRFEIAQQFLELGFTDDAIDIIEQLMQKYPDESELKLFVAECYMENGKEEEALSLLVEITPKEEENYIRAILLASELFMMDGLYEVAEYKIKQALDSYPDEQVLHTALGEVYYQQEKYSLAIVSYERGSIISTYAKLADCYAHVGNFEKALDYYQKATTSDQENPELLFGYGFVAYRLEDYRLAIAKFDRLLEIDPFYTSAYPLLVDMLIKTGQNDQAFETVEKGLKYDQTNPFLFYLRASLLLNRNDVEEAKRALDAALHVDEHHEQSLEKRLELAQHEEDWPISLRMLERLIELHPDQPEWYVEKGKAYEELEEWKEAEEQYRQAVNIDGENTKALNQLGYLLRDEGRPKEAKELWQRSLSIQPDQEELEGLLERLNDV